MEMEKHTCSLCGGSYSYNDLFTMIYGTIDHLDHPDPTDPDEIYDFKHKKELFWSNNYILEQISTSICHNCRIIRNPCHAGCIAFGNDWTCLNCLSYGLDSSSYHGHCSNCYGCYEKKINYLKPLTAQIKTTVNRID